MTSAQSRDACRARGLQRQYCYDQIGQNVGCVKGPGAGRLGRLLAHSLWIMPILSTTKLHRLEENLGAADLDFTSTYLAEIDAEALKVEGLRDRLPKAVLKMTES